MGSSLAKPVPSTILHNFAAAESTASDNSSLQDEDEPLISVASTKLVLVDESDQPETFCVRCRTQGSLPVSHGNVAQEELYRHSHSHLPDFGSGPVAWTDGAFYTEDQSEYTSDYWGNVVGARNVPAEVPSFDSDHSDLILNDDSATCLQDLDAGDHCHSHLGVGSTTKSAQNQLVAASVLCLLFMIGEAVGGYLAGSLAVMTDAAHMLSDFTSFLISLFAIWMGSRPPTKRMSFGYHRAEILGALVSILVIWILAGILVYLAIDRIVNEHYEINADTMIIVSGTGVAINIVMGLVLHGMCHSIRHSHSHGGHSHNRLQNAAANSHSHKIQEQKNINVRAAFIHVIGDLIQSVGVLVAAYIIKYYPSYKIADPICTFIFTILVLITTVKILCDAVNVLMEGFPHNLSYTAIQQDLQSIQGVKMIHSLHIWSLTIGKNALAVHIATSSSVEPEKILKQATKILKKKYHLYHTTVQVEKYDAAVMETCPQCQPPRD